MTKNSIIVIVCLIVVLLSIIVAVILSKSGQEVAQVEPPINSPNAVEINSDSAEESKPDDLEQEELRMIYENQMREEAERLRKAVEEEERFIPLVGDVDKLVQLHPKDRIWLEREVGAVVITGRVVLREGMLELFACKVNSKEHESIISIRVLPELIHAALLAVGAENGKPVQMKPEFVAPSGDEIEVRVKWRGQDGQIKESSAQDWIWDNANSKEDDKKPMKTNWVFTGSQQYKDEEGNNHYLANETGELFGLSNFVGSILDVPIESSADNDKLMFSCFTEKIP
ncbi:MAG: YdjY domain-containing protein, partial [Planctomycetaceae bacterium]|nr:YdjY domain-containing protein [Planctomycetaceae bacterium]